MKSTFFILFAMVTTLSLSAQDYGQYVVDSPKTQAEQDQNKIIEYIIANDLKMNRTASGLFYSLEGEGSGEQPSRKDIVKAHYKGTLLNGTKFDSSYDRGEPLEFPLGRVVKGWQEAIPMLSKGQKGLFLIPSALGYGNRSAGPIPPNSVLVFEIELVDFKSQAQLKLERLQAKQRQKDLDEEIITSYLKNNKIQAEKTESGIYYTMEKAGDQSQKPNVNSKVKVHYEGKVVDGRIFDSSYERGTPIDFKLKALIKGWQECIPLMGKGGKGVFYIPSHLAYGPTKRSEIIGANEVLIFTIELLDFQ